MRIVSASCSLTVAILALVVGNDLDILRLQLRPAGLVGDDAILDGFEHIAGMHRVSLVLDLGIEAGNDASFLDCD